MNCLDVCYPIVLTLEVLLSDVNPKIPIQHLSLWVMRCSFILIYTEIPSLQWILWLVRRTLSVFFIYIFFLFFSFFALELIRVEYILQILMSFGQTFEIDLYEKLSTKILFTENQVFINNRNFNYSPCPITRSTVVFLSVPLLTVTYNFMWVHNECVIMSV